MSHGMLPNETRANTSTQESSAEQLDRYLRQVRRHTLLSRDEERALTEEYVATRKPAIGRRLVEANLRIVVKLAFGYRRLHEDVQDLIQEGNLGLLQAVERYDPKRGVKLATFAAWWIRAYMLRFMINNRCLVRLGTTEAQRKLFFKLGREQRHLEARGVTITDQLLAEHLGVSENEVSTMRMRMGRDEVSLYAPADGRRDEGKRPLVEVLAAEGTQRPDMRAEEGEFNHVLRRKLRAFARTLRGREQALFDERLLAEKPLTLHEVGRRYGISRERARQIEQGLLARLRQYLQAELGAAVPKSAAA